MTPSPSIMSSYSRPLPVSSPSLLPFSQSSSGSVSVVLLLTCTSVLTMATSSSSSSCYFCSCKPRRLSVDHAKISFTITSATTPSSHASTIPYSDPNPTFSSCHLPASSRSYPPPAVRHRRTPTPSKLAVRLLSPFICKQPPCRLRHPS
jgi:hypothetical protein